MKKKNLEILENGRVMEAVNGIIVYNIIVTAV